MKTNLSKRMTVTTVFVILFGVLNILLMLAETQSYIKYGRWDEEWFVWKVLILGGTNLFGLIINVLPMLFMLSSIKTMKSGEFFSKCNARMLWLAVPICFLYNICRANLPVVQGCPRCIIYPDTFFVPLLLIGFAMIYSTGVRLSEENRLTV